MSLSENLKLLRIGKGLTQQQLADALELGQSTIGMIESKKREVGLDVLQKIADFFSVSTDFLLYGFEKTELSKLMKYAVSSTSIDDFSENLGIEKKLIENIINGSVDERPPEELLIAIGDYVNNFMVDSLDLLKAAGYINEDEYIEKRQQQLKEIKEKQLAVNPSSGKFITLAASRTDGYDGPLSDDEKAIVKAALDAYRKGRYNKN